MNTQRVRNGRIRTLLAVIVLFGGMLVWQPVCIRAAETVYTASVPGEAAAGDQIAVTISVSDNPGLTTLGLQLGYDDQVLRYQRAVWVDGLSGGNDSLTLISDVVSEGKQVLNVSMIDSSAYRDNGAMVTLYFDVLQAYTESPVTLKLRDATDGNENPVGGSAQVAFSSGSPSAGSPVSSGTSETGTSNDTGYGSGEIAVEEQAVPSQTTANRGQSGEYDHAFKTGGFVWTPLLLAAGLLFLGIAVGCGVVQDGLKRHGRREIRDIIGSKEH